MSDAKQVVFLQALLGILNFLDGSRMVATDEVVWAIVYFALGLLWFVLAFLKLRSLP